MSENLRGDFLTHTVHASRMSSRVSRHHKVTTVHYNIIPCWPTMIVKTLTREG